MYDAIIIGGGPSGSVAAYVLAKKGFKVLLLEKDPPNRYKPCAGGIAPETVYVLTETLGLKIPNKIIETKVESSRLIHHTEEIFLTKATRQEGYCVYRTKFDQWLRNTAMDAGAEIKYECEAHEIRILKDYVEVKHRCGESKGKVLIGAFGSHGISRFYSQLGIKEKQQFAIAIQREFMLPEEDFDPLSETIELYFGSDVSTRGYFWIFPKVKSRGVSVGLVECLTKQSSQSKMIERLDKIIREHPVVSKRLLHAKPIKVGGVHLSASIIAYHPLSKPYGNRFILVGEAAGLVEGFSWEGISTAVKSGIIGAEVIADALEKDRFDEDILKRYYHRIKKEIIDKDLVYRNALGEVIYSFSPKTFDKIIRGLFKLIRMDKDIEVVISGAIGRIVSGKELFNILFSKKFKAIKAFGPILAIKLFWKLRRKLKEMLK